MKRKNIFFTLLLLFSQTIFSFISENPKKRLTIEWRFSSEAQEKLSTPQYEWLNNSKILMLDYRINKNSRTLELFDIKAKKRSSAADREKVLKALKKHLGEKAPSGIEWPDAIDLNGKALIYILYGDLFLVEFTDSVVKRLTYNTTPETSPSFSPDGRWISFIRENELFAIDLTTGEERQLTKGATDALLNGPLSWAYWEEIYDHTPVPYRWSPDSQSIAYLQTDESEVSFSTFINFEPVTQGVVRQRYPKAGQANPKVRLGIVDLSSAKTTWIDCGKYEYIARFNWLRNSQEISVQTLNRRQSELRLIFANRRSGRSREILMDRQSAWINLNNSLYFLEDGERFIWLSERDGYQHLYLYRMDGQLIRQLTQGDYMVQSSIGRLVDMNGGLVGVEEKAGWVYFTSDKHSLRERHLYRIKLDGTGLKRLSEGNGVHAVSLSPNMRYYLERFSNASNPPSLSLHDAEGKLIHMITPSAKATFVEFNISFPEFHTFKAEDGLELPAMLTKPVNFNPEKKYPAVIYVYGGPGSQQVLDSWPRFMSWNGLLAQEGFIEVVLEVRTGMGKSKALETSVYRRAYGMQNVKDILSGVRWLKSLPYIDAENIGIWGWSGGGCTTLYSITHTDVFKAAVAIAPVSDWRFYDTIYTERYLGTPQDNPEGYRETSSVLAASNLKTQLLIVHGSYDDNVHPQNTLTFISKLIEHGIKFEMMIYPWRKHGISDDSARIHLYNMMLDFWKRNLIFSHPFCP